MIWFVLFLWHIKYCRLFNTKSSLYIYIKYIGFVFFGGGGLWHINHCRLFNAKSSLDTYIKYMGFGLFVVFFWHINHCRLFNAKSSLDIYIKYMGFGLFVVFFFFFGISTIVGYLMPNPLYTYILNI